MSQIRAPFIDLPAIAAAVDAFRGDYPIARHIPVDIERILETMGIEIVVEPGCREHADFDACICHDFKSILVDAGHYGDDRFYPRVRFSLAHELGHLVLHQDFFAQFNIRTPDEWFQFLREIDDTQYRLLEWQANQFAGQLLVPADELVGIIAAATKPHESDSRRQLGDGPSLAFSCRDNTRPSPDLFIGGEFYCFLPAVRRIRRGTSDSP